MGWIMPASKQAHPIIMSPPMVRALLESRKTQTRRVMKPQPKPDDWGGITWGPTKSMVRIGYSNNSAYLGKPHPVWLEKCPYGLPGDLLWVRETWRGAEGLPSTLGYRANYTEQRPPKGWKSSLFMPRWASRLTLELMEVRVQRLQDISCADAIAEGISPSGNCITIDCDTPDPRREYASLWESLHGKGSWDANPWVWALSFRVHHQNIDQFLKQRGAA